MSDFFLHPAFREAVEDMESLGVRVSLQPIADARPFAVINGRSNARWWLLPITKGRVTASGLALFQPLLPSARFMKAAASTFSYLGLNRLWVGNRIYISGDPGLTRYFPIRGPLEYAYFTGTDSPHRKVAVQIMDSRGRLKGFAKLTRNPQVRTLLAHEAEMLKYVYKLRLQTAHVPKVLFAGNCGEAFLLVTDTLKTPFAPSITEFSAAHRAFVLELAQKTASSTPMYVSEIAAEFRAQFNRIRSFLEQSWDRRLDEAISTLEKQSSLQLSVGLIHGDFTPWNTFMAHGRLYVFDWEYAEYASTPSNDIIHFLLNEPQTRNLLDSEKIKSVLASLSLPWTKIEKQTAPTLLAIYLLSQNLRQIECLSEIRRHGQLWDGAKESAAMFDNLLSGYIAGQA